MSVRPSGLMSKASEVFLMFHVSSLALCYSFVQSDHKLKNMRQRLSLISLSWPLLT